MRVFTIILLSFYISYANSQELHVIPAPTEMVPQKGTFSFTASSNISISDKKLEKCSQFLSEIVLKSTGFNLKTNLNKKSPINLLLNDIQNPELGAEGYNLQVTTTEITISANSPAGIYYGIQTLIQLLPADIESNSAIKRNWKIPCVKIKDYPRFAWRGLMLDVSRHFFSKEDVKTYIDQMSKFKFNVFHWHLSDDQGWRVEIKSCPKLTEVGAWRVERFGQFGTMTPPGENEKATYGGFYTQDDIREIVKYASDRFITIVPEIDMPGHSMAAVASYPELSCTRDTTIKVDPGTPFSEWYGNGTFKMNIDNTFNPSNEKVYEFLDKVLGEIAALFPGDYFHVGGDECYKGFWKRDSACHELMKKLNTHHVDDLQGYFMNRVENILKSKGKKMIGWDEILEGNISKDAAVMCWRDMNVGTEAAANGYKIVMSPTAYSYLDYYQGEPFIEAPVYAGLRLSQCYKLEPVLVDSVEKNILGGQANLWTENIPNLHYAQYMIWPRALAISEVYWSPKSHKNWDLFIKKVETQFTRFDKADINYSKAIYDPIIKTFYKNDRLWVDISCEAPDLEVFYTIDGTMPDTHSQLYTGEFELPEGQITLRLKTYRDKKQLGNLIILKPDDLRKRAW